MASKRGPSCSSKSQLTSASVFNSVTYDEFTHVKSVNRQIFLVIINAKIVLFYEIHNKKGLFYHFSFNTLLMIAMMTRITIIQYIITLQFSNNTAQI